MAFDHSPTQNRIIATVAIVTGVSLVSLKFVFDSYFVDVIETEVREKMLPNTEIAAMRAESEQRLTSGTMPIAKAKSALAERGRGSFAEISPKPSEDVRALVGWSKLPKPATEISVTPAVAPTSSTSVSADAGAPHAGGDAGAPHVASDAGAPHGGAH